jgi:hypothetical protein
MKPQKEIEREQDAVRVILYIYMFDGTNCTSAAIQWHYGFEPSRIANALYWLECRKYIQIRDGSIFIDELGHEYIEGIKETSIIGQNKDGRDYKEEALTGLTQIKSPKTGRMVSRKSKLVRPVLPSNKKHHETATPEDSMIEKDRALKAKMKLAKDLNTTVEKLENFISEGRLKMCPKCKKVGIFDKRGGGYMAVWCRKCRKLKYKKKGVKK